MNGFKMWTAFVLAIVLMLALAACGGSETGAEPTAPPLGQAEATELPPAEEAAEPTQAPEEGGQEPTPAEQTEEEATEQPAAEGPETEESEIPLDVPIMEGAIDLQVQRDLGSIIYMLEDTEIQDVVDFYETQMTALGWESQTASKVGLMASLIFEKEGNRVTASLQANNIAHTVNVRLFVHEK